MSTGARRGEWALGQPSDGEEGLLGRRSGCWQLAGSKCIKLASARVAFRGGDFVVMVVGGWDGGWMDGRRREAGCGEKLREAWPGA